MVLRLAVELRAWSNVETRDCAIGSARSLRFLSSCGLTKKMRRKGSLKPLHSKVFFADCCH